MNGYPITYFVTVVISQAESLFHYGNLPMSGRKRRQTSDPASSCTSFQNCAYTPYAGPTFEDFNFTEAQRALCNNIRECLFDLAITGNDDIADLSRETSENSTAVQMALSRFTAKQCCVY